MVGKVKVLNDSETSRFLLKEMILKKKEKIQTSSSEMESRNLENITSTDKEVRTVDEEMETFPNIFKEEFRVKMSDENNLWPGDSLGGISPHRGKGFIASSFYFSDYTCQLLYITHPVKCFKGFSNSSLFKSL
jgi:hypothetical protein